MSSITRPELARVRSDEITPIGFTQREQDCLRAAFAVLLSPLDSIDAQTWRGEVGRTLSELLGADRASFQLEIPGIPLLYSEDYSQATLDAYVDHYKDIDIGRQRRDALGAEVWNRWLLHGRDLRSFWESEIHHDFLVPNRILDSMGLTVKVRGAAMPATLFFHRDKPGTAEFGERGVALLSMLLPAFKAGVRDIVRYSHQRESLTTHLDELTTGIRISDFDGSTVHQNPAFTAALTAEETPERLERAIGEIITALAELSAERGDIGAALAGDRITQEIHTNTASYQLGGSFLGRELLGAERRVAISLERLAPDTPLSDSALQARFKLTPRELEIARRLSQGQSTRDVSHACGISIHTTRRHTERIFNKLGVRNRSQLGPRLRGE
ncbi:MAG: helix-turn-helix transcriptional regulator [Gemmatimonadota bacterium]|nr:helix-turn-helix transcriptional regulator [Gemmatimonadota bacterium]